MLQDSKCEAPKQKLPYQLPKLGGFAELLPLKATVAPAADRQGGGQTLDTSIEQL